MIDSEDIRLEQFRQLKKEIRGSKVYLIVGIDVAKAKHHAFFGTATGKTLFKRLVFENNIEGFELLLTRVHALKAQHALDRVVFGLEPTANYHKPLAEHLIKCGHLVVMVGGESIKSNRKLLDGRWNSNDTKDAANVADLISQGKCLFYEYPAMAIRELRNLLSLKRRFKRQEHGLKVRIRNNLIAQYFPELDKYYGNGEKQVLSIVRWSLNPSIIAGLSLCPRRPLCPRKKGFTSPGGKTYTYSYDAANQLSGVNIPGKGLIAYIGYHWNRPAKITLPGGSAMSYCQHRFILSSDHRNKMSPEKRF